MFCSTLIAWAVLLVPTQDARKPAPPARVTVSAPLACLHCTFGEGENCAVCLKLDDKTPVLLTGKAAKPFEEHRLEATLVVAAGTLTQDKDKRLTLATESVKAAKDAAGAPAKGEARIEGHACCGKCDLGKCDVCTMAVKNAAFPIILAGKLADQHAGEGEAPRPVIVTGKLFLDKAGLLRVEATKAEDVKKK